MDSKEKSAGEVLDVPSLGARVIVKVFWFKQACIYTWGMVAWVDDE